MREREDYERTFEDFWRPLVTNPDGTLDEDKVKRELHDYRCVMQEASKVYYEVSGGRISKPNTMAFEVIGEHTRLVDELVEEALRERDDPYWAERAEMEIGRYDEPPAKADGPEPDFPRGKSETIQGRRRWRR